MLQLNKGHPIQYILAMEGLDDILVLVKYMPL